MARLARIVVPGFAHHVTQRGNRRSEVFTDDLDRRKYLAAFGEYKQKHGLEVWSYCLMSNHVHWIVVPKVETALSRSFRDAHTAYTVHFNQRQKLSGHLWQGRFFSCVLDTSHIWAAVRYVERNPVRAGIVKKAEDYPWSSAAAHCGKRIDPLLSVDFPPTGVIPDWSEWLKTEESHSSDEIRQRTHTGRPCGSVSFFEQLEGLLNRVVRPQKAGRKKKVRDGNAGALLQ